MMLSVQQAFPDTQLRAYVRAYVQRDSGPLDERRERRKPVVGRGTMRFHGFRLIDI